MSSRVVPLEAALEPSWERFVASRPGAGIYHTLAWKRVTEERLGHRAKYLCALDEHGEVTGVLPLFEVGGLFGRRLVSIPMRDRGSVVASDEATAAALVSSAVALGVERRARYLELRGLEPLPIPVLGARPSGRSGGLAAAGAWHARRHAPRDSSAVRRGQLLPTSTPRGFAALTRRSATSGGRR